MARNWHITGARVVLPDRVVDDTSLTVEDGIISAIGADRPANGRAREVDAAGLVLTPGLIDLHTDTLEKEICPRRGADFPIEIAMQELDRRLLACGITSVYHSLPFGHQDSEFEQRSRYKREEIIRSVGRFGPSLCLARTHLHLRFEVAGRDRSEGVLEFLDEGIVDLLSFMDHTPGQGQYRAERFIADRMRAGKTEEQACADLDERMACPKVPDENLRRVSERAREMGIVIASHDDCTPEKVARMHRMGVTISEFPINMESARAAHDLGMVTMGGASNSLRGGSLSDNLNVNDALAESLIDGLCSDYYPPAILHAIFKLWRGHGWALHDAVNLGTLAPARAVGHDDRLGSVAPGRSADLLLVDTGLEYPRVVATLVDGCWAGNFGIPGPAPEAAAPGPLNLAQAQ